MSAVSDQTWEWRAEREWMLGPRWDIAILVFATTAGINGLGGWVPEGRWTGLLVDVGALMWVVDILCVRFSARGQSFVQPAPRFGCRNAIAAA